MLHQELVQLFPELDIEEPLSSELTYEELILHPYFTDLVDLMIQNIEEESNDQPMNIKNFENNQITLEDIKNISNFVQMCEKTMTVVNPKKGTVIYTAGSEATEAYLLIQGCIELLVTKTAKERAEEPSEHMMHSQNERSTYLQTKFSIDSTKISQLEPIFFEHESFYTLTPFRTLYNKGYFGIRELLRNSLYTKTSIATQNSILLKITKSHFDNILYHFESIRENYLLNNLLSSTQESVFEDIKMRMFQAISCAEIIHYRKNQIVIDEGERTKGIYYLLSGGCEIEKKVVSNSAERDIEGSKNGKGKENCVKILKLVKNSFVGELEVLLAINERQFSVIADENDTILLKLEESSFLMAIAESSIFEQELLTNSKSKYTLLQSTYTKQSQKLLKTLIKKPQATKQHKLIDMISTEPPHKQEIISLYTRQKDIYRDTYEKFKGFDNFMNNYDPKRSSIPKHRLESASEHELKDSLNSMKVEKCDIETEPNTAVLSNMKLRNSSGELQRPIRKKSVSENIKIKKRKLSQPQNKFETIAKDEQIYKRILIKHGEYKINRETSKVNTAKALVNHKFDFMIKECLSHKSLSFRKAILEHNNALIKENYEQTLATINKDMQESHILMPSSEKCRNIQELKNKIKKFNHTRTLSKESIKQPLHLETTEKYTIPFNMSKTNFSYQHVLPINTRQHEQDPIKIVLLNHMMKPITYTSKNV